MNILVGIVGAVVGFFAGLFVFDISGLSDKYDPIASGMTALFVFGPAGAVAGVFLGTWLLMRMRGLRAATGEGVSAAAASDEATAAAQGAAASGQAAPAVATASKPPGSVAQSSLKSLAVVVLLVLVSGAFYYVYAVSTATPWLNPNAANPVLQFEIRLPHGVPMPAQARDIAIELQTDQNTMPAELRPARFRSDGEQAVIAGEVELAFRTRKRALEVKIKGHKDRLYPIRLTDKAPHAPELGSWQTYPDDTSEIRYRAKWPGRD